MDHDFELGVVEVVLVYIERMVFAHEHKSLAQRMMVACTQGHAHTHDTDCKDFEVLLGQLVAKEQG
jgi:hypothetical protein